jgi:hypothetical protein
MFSYEVKTTRQHYRRTVHSGVDNNKILESTHARVSLLYFASLSGWNSVLPQFNPSVSWGEDDNILST